MIKRTLNYKKKSPKNEKILLVENLWVFGVAGKFHRGCSWHCKLILCLKACSCKSSGQWQEPGGTRMRPWQQEEPLTETPESTGTPGEKRSCTVNQTPYVHHMFWRPYIINDWIKQHTLSCLLTWCAINRGIQLSVKYFERWYIGN